MVLGKDSVFTPLGKGRVVYKLNDGSLLVEFDHGGGHIFRADELFRSQVGSQEVYVREWKEGRDQPLRGRDVP